jgi:CHASE1-domain containing sensor protein
MALHLLANALMAALSSSAHVSRPLSDTFEMVVGKLIARAVSDRVEILCGRITQSTEVLRAIAAFFAVQNHVSRNEFHRFVAGAVGRKPELLAIEWVPSVRTADRTVFEAKAREEGFGEFTSGRKTKLGETDSRDLSRPVCVRSIFPSTMRKPRSKS